METFILSYLKKKQEQTHHTLCFLYIILSIPSLGLATLCTTVRAREWLCCVGWSASVPSGGVVGKRKEREDKQLDPSPESFQLFLVQAFWNSCWNKLMILMDFSSMNCTSFPVWHTDHPSLKSLVILILSQMTRYCLLCFSSWKHANFVGWNLSKILQETVNRCSLLTVSVTFRI